MSTHAVTLLGVKGGPAIRPGSPMPTSSLVQITGQNLLIDAGLGCTGGVVQAGVALSDVDGILISHLHSDHFLELGPFLHTAWTAGLRSPIPVFGPSGLKDYLGAFFRSMKYDIDLRIEDEGRPDLRDLIELHPISAEFRVGGVNVRAMKNLHPPIEESYALRLDAEGASVTFSGDTAPMDEMADFARQTSLLVHEAMLEAGIDALCARVGNGDARLKAHLLRSHTPAADAGRIARRAEVGALALHHLIPSDDPDFIEDDWRAEVRRTWSGPLHIGRDGLCIAFGP